LLGKAGLSGHHGGVIAIAWSAIGLLAATLGVLGSVAYSSLARIDAMGATLGERIDSQGEALVARIDSMTVMMSARIDAQTSRINALYARSET
jgi:hypothetical protein